jgi:hypothetical protein
MSDHVMRCQVEVASAGDPQQRWRTLSVRVFLKRSADGAIEVRLDAGDHELLAATRSAFATLKRQLERHVRHEREACAAAALSPAPLAIGARACASWLDRDWPAQ